MNEVPRLPSGKTDFVSLLGLGRAAWARRHSATTQNGLRAAFCEALDIKSVTATDSFNSLGGDSLACVTVSMAIEQELGHLPEHWELLTIGEIEARAAQSAPDTKRRFQWIPAEMLVRAFAILPFTLIDVLCMAAGTSTPGVLNIASALASTPEPV